MSRIIAVANAKGGVGKTTTAVNLSAALAEAGHRVLAIDLDPQSSLTLSLGMNPLRVPGTICNLLTPGSDFLNAPIIHLQEQWDLIPANEELRALEHELDSDPKKIYTIGAGLHPFRDVYDYIILDCAASMGVLTGAALAAADSVIIPLTPDFLAFQVSAILFRIIRRVQETINPNLQIAGIFLTMYDTRTKHAREILTHIRKTYGASVPFFSAVIYNSVKLKEAPSLGQSVVKYAPQSQAARAYRVVARELVEGAPKPKHAPDKLKKNGAQNSALLANENGKAKAKVKEPVSQPAQPVAQPTQPIAPAAPEPAAISELAPIESARNEPIAQPLILAAEAPAIDAVRDEIQSAPVPATDEFVPDADEPAEDDLAQPSPSPLPIFEIHNDPPIDHHASQVTLASGAEAVSVKEAEAGALNATALDDKQPADRAGQGENGFKGKLVQLVGKMRTAVPKPNGNGSGEKVSGLFKKLRERGRQANGNGAANVTPIQTDAPAAANAEAAVTETPVALVASVETPGVVADSTQLETPVALQAAPNVAIAEESEPAAVETDAQVETPTAEIEIEKVDAVAEEPIEANVLVAELENPVVEAGIAQAESSIAETPVAQVETLIVETEIPAAELVAAEDDTADAQDTDDDVIPLDVTTTSVELVTEETASRIDELDAAGGEANDTEQDENDSPVAIIETIVVEPTLALEPHDDVPPAEAVIYEPQAEVVGPPFDVPADAAAAPVAEQPSSAELPRIVKPSEIWSLPYIPPSQREPATVSVVGSDVILADERYVEEQEPTIQELLRRVAMLTSDAPAQESETEPEDEEPDFEKLTQELFGAEPDAYSGSELILPPALTAATTIFADSAQALTTGLQLQENPLVNYRATEIARDDVEAWIRRAEGSEAPWEALAAWLHVLEINPLNGYARTRMEEMIRAWLEIAKRDEVDELIKLGNSLVQAGQRAPADETYRRVIELNPRAPRAWLGRALVTSNPLERLVFVQRGLELAPGDPEVRRALAEARDQLTSEANRLLEEGLHLAHSGRTAQAHLLFKHAVELAPLDDRAWLGCARTADNLPSKLSYLKQALTINPANTEAQDLYRILTNFMGTGKKERWAIVPEDPRVIYFALGLLMLLAALVAIPLFIIH